MKAYPLVTCAALAVLTLASVGRAADPPSAAATQEGRDRFKRAIELFRDANFRAALIEFNRANDVAPNYKIQYNIAQTCLELQDYACALHAFGLYLADGGKDVRKDRRQSVEGEIDRLKKLVGTVHVTSNKDGAEVAVDDVVVGRTPLADPMIVGLGRHKISVSLAPLPPGQRVVDIAGADSLEVDIPLAEPAATLPVAAALPAGTGGVVAPVGPPAPAATVPSRAPFWVSVAATGVLGGATAVTGAFALSAKSNLDDTSRRLGVTTGEVDSARTTLRTFSAVADVLLVSTVVAAGISTVLYFTTSPGAGASRSGRGSWPGAAWGTF